jgi:3-isopropylmalate/(R)-2-methylmalate dehydratase small subunit
MIIRGRVHKFGDNINTDDIIAAKYLVSTDARELGQHCMEFIRPGFNLSVRQGDIIVAGRNFGCGSSREHAPLAIKGCGIKAVIARSFAGIFFRNAINIGLPFVELGDTDQILEGEELEINLSSGIIINLSRNQNYHSEPFPEFLREIVSGGGLMCWLKSKKGVRG